MLVVGNFSPAIPVRVPRMITTELVMISANIRILYGAVKHRRDMVKLSFKEGACVTSIG